MLAGIGLLASKGLAGTADLLLAHGLLTAGLFLLVGVVLALLRAIDELDLHGRGAKHRWLAPLWAVAALGLAGPPYVGVYLGHALIDEAASESGRHWVPPLLWLAGALASAALLRAGARIFLGWGPPADPLLSPEAREKPPERKARVPLLAIAAVATIVLGLATSVVPGLAQRSERAAERFRDRAGYAASVLHGAPTKLAPRPPYAVAHTTAASVVYGVGATLVALSLAALGLFRLRLPRRIREPCARALGPPLEGLRTVHSGVIGDYVMWVTVGTAVTGGVWALVLR
jgi:multicomponent Na+:H+ antiporter subunit D